MSVLPLKADIAISYGWNLASDCAVIPRLSLSSADVAGAVQAGATVAAGRFTIFLHF
jgi:hypothetical protein